MKFAVAVLLVWCAVSIPAILLLGRIIAGGASSDPAGDNAPAAGTLPAGTPIE